MSEKENKFELPKEVQSFIDIEADSEEDFRAKFNEKFVPRDKIKEDNEIVNSIVGERIGSIETKVKSLLKKNGVELTGEEIKDKKVEDIAELGFSKLASVYEEKINEVKGASKAPDKAAKELQDKLDKIKADKEREVSDLKTLNEDLKTKYDELQSTSAQKLQSMTMKVLEDSVVGSIDWASDADYFKERQAALLNEFSRKFKRKLSEDGNQIIVTDTDGNRIKDEDKAGEFISFDKLLKKEAAKAKLLKLNESGGKPAAKPPPGAPTPPPPSPNGKDKRVINTVARG